MKYFDKVHRELRNGVIHQLGGVILGWYGETELRSRFGNSGLGWWVRRKRVVERNKK
jgi:hypothetical protein